MRKILAIVCAVTCLYIFTGCGAPHPKIEEKKASGEEARVKFNPDAVQAVEQAASQQQEQQTQEQQPAQPAQ